jgi:hypothetical protein
VPAVSRASRLVRESVAALENCVCLESVARLRADKKAEVQNQRDTLQIEATTIGDREWFSLPGRADIFVEDPRDLVSTGLVNTGQLTSILKTVFLGGFAARTFHSAGVFQKRPALRFDYSVRSIFTHFHLNTARSGIAAGMRGSFWIDAHTGELVALSSEATEIPPDFEIRTARTEVIYAPMYPEERRVLLPQTAITTVEDFTGATSINRVEFSHCHPYSSSSSIRFDSDVPAKETAPYGGRGRLPIPAGVSLRMGLATPLTERAAIGDRLSLVMESDARSHGETIIEKGTQVMARVRSIEGATCSTPCFVVALELLSVTTKDGSSHPLYAKLRQVTPEPRVKLGGPKAEPQSVGIPEIPGVGSFVVLTPGLTAPPELVMTWSTEDPGRP